MLYLLIALVFVLGYAAIALEHPLKIDKSVSALLTAAVCWALLAFYLPGDGAHTIHHQLLEGLGEIASIIFFLLGAMALVELIDVHGGFDLITNQITTRKKSTLLISLAVLTFFMSSVLDNLTTAVVIATLIKKLVNDKRDLVLFAGMTVIAANAGGAFSPIGDVTTIMLWVDNRVTAGNIIARLLVPSMVSLAIPLALVATRLKGSFAPLNTEVAHAASHHAGHEKLPRGQSLLMLILGISLLLFVPVFKSVTHLPPFVGILFGVAVLSLVAEVLHRNKSHSARHGLVLPGVLKRLDLAGILFFLGILLAVNSLLVAGHLGAMATWLNETLGSYWIINSAIGVLSAIVDNVPLVAAAMGMYTLEQYPTDHIFWELLALCAGTGGSILIIGSAAGVAIMGIIHIDFITYLKRISLPALLGYAGGILTLWLMT